MTVMRPQGGYKPGVYDTVGECSACGKPMLSKWAWSAGVRRPDHVCNGARGMCHKHYVRWTRHGDTKRRVPVGAPPEAAPRDREEVLEEYTLVRESVANIRQAAERLGMKFSTLDKALYRARLDGDPRAMPPSNQYDRALEQGRPYRLGGAS